MSKWTHSICEACWDKRNSFREPTRLAYPERDECCYCGNNHYSGIYVREDPESMRCHGERGTHAS